MRQAGVEMELRGVEVDNFDTLVFSTLFSLLLEHSMGCGGSLFVFVLFVMWFSLSWY